MRGGNDLIILCAVRSAPCAGKPLVEERGPVGDHELTISSLSKLAARTAVGIAIHHDDGAVIGLAARFRLGELGRVERAVAAATYDDDVPQRMSLPPSMTRTVPVA